MKELVGTVQSHWWLSEEDCTFAQQEDRYVNHHSGTWKEIVGQVLAALEGS